MPDTIERRVKIVNEAGLHARPCHAIASTALTYSSELRISCGAREVNGRSILGLMTLEGSRGRELSIRATGDDAEALVAALEALVVSGFDESP